MLAPTARFSPCDTLRPGGMRDVAYVLPEYPVASQTFVHAELAALREAGLTVDVVSDRAGPRDLRFGDDLGGEPLPVAHLGLSDAAPVLAGYRHLHGHFADFGVRRLVPLAAEAGRPCSFTAHAYDLFRRDAAVRPEEWAALPETCRSVVTISRFHREFITARGLDAGRVVVIPNAARLVALFATPAPPPARLKRLLAVGRPVAKKGFPVLVQAWARARRTLPDLELTIVGGQGLVVDPPPGLDLRPMLPYAETLRLMATADLVVAPSVVAPDGDMDGIPTVLVEACALRRPVVASRVTGVGDLVCDGVNGLLVPPNDIDALVSTFLRLAARPVELQRLGSGGPMLAAAHDARRVAERLVEVFAA